LLFVVVCCLLFGACLFRWLNHLMTTVECINRWIPVLDEWSRHMSKHGVEREDPPLSSSSSSSTSSSATTSATTTDTTSVTTTTAPPSIPATNAATTTTSEPPPPPPVKEPTEAELLSIAFPSRRPKRQRYVVPQTPIL